MALILAIEADRRQSNLLATIGRQLGSELVIAATAQSGLAAIAGRVPDLILTSALLSPTDETVLANRLRELDAQAAHVQTLTIPVLAKPSRHQAPASGLLGRLRGSSQSQAPCGCDPSLFAAQISEYLAHAATARRVEAEALNDAHGDRRDEPATVATVRQRATERVPVADEPAAVVTPLAAELDEKTRRPAIERIAAKGEIELANALHEDGDEKEEAVDLTARGFYAELEATLEELDVAMREAPTVRHPVESVPAELLVEPADGIGDSSEITGDLPEDEAWAALAASVTPWPELESPDITIDASFASFAEAPAASVIPESRVIEAPAVAVPVAAAPIVEAPVVEAPVADEPPPAHVPSPRRSEARQGRKQLPRRPRPPQDEWGLFDPNQCGFTALLEKLDELAASANDGA